MSYALSVKALCEFTGKRGDLDLRFTPAPSAQQGMAGHAVVAARRGKTYQTEVALTGTHGELLVRGRADGFDSGALRVTECKTFRGDLKRVRANHRALHWAQLKTYGALLCRREGFASINLSLVYFDIESQKESVFDEQFSAADLEAFFAASCEEFSGWAASEEIHKAARNDALTTLRFPHEAFHAGQRDLAEASYRVAASGGTLLAQAPTGIGKTIGTVFPLLKALATGKLDRVFYLAARTTGRALALTALARLQTAAPQLQLRVLELVARDKLCVHPGKSCHGESCPLAQGFYDKLPAARVAAIANPVMDRDSLCAVAQEHAVCPYYLAQEMVRWSDVVVGDYNYWFAHNALLFGLTQEHGWRVGVLVDEAHNLVPRAREMYSATLHSDDFVAAREVAGGPASRLLARVSRLLDDCGAPDGVPYTVYDELPERLVGALKELVTHLNDAAAAEQEAAPQPLRQAHFAAVQFCRLAEAWGGHSLLDATDAAGRRSLCLRNIVPAPFLARRFEQAQCTVLFSATLSPRAYYQDMLGIASARWLDVRSPFDAAQLSVRIVAGISTRYRQRERSLAPVAALVAAQFAAQPGNYLLFASSFDYLQQLAAAVRTQCPDVALWQQQPAMNEADRQDFIARFTAQGEGIGFAVLGGAFAEGIDLPGKRLIGAFIVTLGLPQVNPVNEQIMQRLEASFGSGHDYAYLCPGIQRVVQAAGRVIRTLSDRGTLILIDERYATKKVRDLLPAWWQLAREPASVHGRSATAMCRALTEGGADVRR
ncbi:MAG: ATP-dependent DNA helicase [Pseudomonadota bacterium]